MDDFENKDRGFDGAEQEGGTTRIDMPRRHRREEAPEDAPEREKRDVAGRIESVINKIKELLGRKSEKQMDEELFTERRGSRSFILELLFTVLKVMAVTVIIAGSAGLGLVTGVAKAYIETTEDIDPAQLTKSDRTSYIYDKDGKLITTYAGMEYRDWADIGEIPDMLKNALISIEDVRFYKHDGVDYKRLFSAVINTLRNTDTHGGSTITQQLIKNKVLSNEQSYKRKIKEAYLSMELENIMDKDEILAAYMNDVYLGASNYGFKTAAKDYFGKEMSEPQLYSGAAVYRAQGHGGDRNYRRKRGAGSRYRRCQGIHRDYRGHRSCTAHQERQDFLHIRQGRQAHNHLRRHGISGLGGYRRDTGYAQECPDFHRGRALLQA